MPRDDSASVTAIQVPAVNRLIAAGHRQAGEPDILLVADAGYDSDPHGVIISGA